LDGAGDGAGFDEPSPPLADFASEAGGFGAIGSAELLAFNRPK
jgi:hypothetical protein